MFIERSLLLVVLAAAGCSHAEPDTTTRTRTTHSERETSGAEVRHDDTIERPIARPTRTDEGDEALPTAMDQSNEPADLEITRLIREAVVSDGAISIGARSSVVIVTRGAMVTLRGDVSSERERAAIDAHAHHVSGVASVENHITVTP